MLTRPTFLIALFAGLLCLSPFAIADQTIDECARIAECTTQCESAADTTCLESCGATIEMQSAITALEACEIDACPGGEPGCGTPACETERLSVLFVCLGADAGCIAASQCIDSQCSETFDINCVNSCTSEHLEGETLAAANDFFGCADVNCGNLTDAGQQAECVEANCSAQDEAFRTACNFDALDGGSDGGIDSGEDDPDDPACDRFQRCVFTCDDPNDWTCLTACTDDLPESPGADIIYDFLVCGQNNGCYGPDDEACVQQNCLGEALALADVCGGNDDGYGEDDDEDGPNLSQACTEFGNCIERCEDWACTERCSAFLETEDSRDAFAALSACAQANGCAPDDDDCLNDNCGSEFVTFFSTCLEEDDDGSPYSPDCLEFQQCVEICSTWECTESCQTTSITDETTNAAIDAIQACGEAAECAPSGGECLDTQCGEELRVFEAACMMSGEDTAGGSNTTGNESTDDSSGNAEAANDSDTSSDDDGCQSVQASSALALLLLLVVLYFQRPLRVKPVKVRRQPERRKRR